MNITLIISISILVFGLLGMFNYNRVNATIDPVLARFGRLATPMKYVLFGLFLIVFVAALYSVAMWIRSGIAPTLAESLEDLRTDASTAGTQAGNQMMSGSNIDTVVINPNAPKDKTNLAAQASGLTVVHSGTSQMGVIGLSSIPDNLLEKYYLPRFDTQAPSQCSRTYKHGSCTGVSRHFVNEQLINTCNKIQVVAPQSIPFDGNVRFTL